MAVNTGERLLTLDAVRGIAVMGILLMNIVAFSMPQAAYISPAAWGGTDPLNAGTWAAMFVLVEGKMRGLFSILFGASMLLVYSRAQEAAGNGLQVHLRRMGWLLVFGLAHFYLIWFGDILALYAVCGMAGVFLLKKSPEALRRWAWVLIGINFVVFALVMGALLFLQYAASLPGADAELAKNLRQALDGIGLGDAAAKAEVARHQGSWWAITWHKLTVSAFDPLWTVLQSGLETLGLMALGMYLFKNRFLTGEWSTASYRRLMIICYAIGLPPLVLLAAWVFASGFDPVVSLSVFTAFATPSRIAVMLGHAALIMLVLRRFQDSAAFGRIAAAGQAAFTNYLGTSILMTTLFYGYGFGWFGTLERWQVYLVVPVVWAIMLLWSKPWLARFRYGPLEWLWRSLSRGQIEPLHKKAIAND